MKKAKVFVDGIFAGVLEELTRGTRYRFTYDDNYNGESVSLLMPVGSKTFEYTTFPPFFDGLLPEGMQLEALLKGAKIDADDMLGQLIVVGHDLVGNVTVEPYE
jgi:serine/threonine-protein kinase HipA